MNTAKKLKQLKEKKTLGDIAQGTAFFWYVQSPGSMKGAGRDRGSGKGKIMKQGTTGWEDSKLRPSWVTVVSRPA